MSIEGQGNFFTIYFPGFVCFVLYYVKISGERLQDQWSSGFKFLTRNKFALIHVSIIRMCNKIKSKASIFQQYLLCLVV